MNASIAQLFSFQLQSSPGYLTSTFLGAARAGTDPTGCRATALPCDPHIYQVLHQLTDRGIPIRLNIPVYGRPRRPELSRKHVRRHQQATQLVAAKCYHAYFVQLPLPELAPRHAIHHQLSMCRHADCSQLPLQASRHGGSSTSSRLPHLSCSWTVWTCPVCHHFCIVFRADEPY